MEEAAGDLSDPELWFEMADHRLGTCQRHFEAEEYRDSVSDAYYAMFYAARAALASIKDEARRHSSVLSRFSDQFVKTGHLDRRYSTLLAQRMRSREEADYVIRAKVTREKARAALADADEFVRAVKDFVQGQGRLPAQ